MVHISFAHGPTPRSYYPHPLSPPLNTRGLSPLSWQCPTSAALGPGPRYQAGGAFAEVGIGLVGYWDIGGSLII